jgi:hypothetical protein
VEKMEGNEDMEMGILGADCQAMDVPTLASESRSGSPWGTEKEFHGGSNGNWLMIQCKSSARDHVIGSENVKSDRRE